MTTTRLLLVAAAAAILGFGLSAAAVAEAELEPEAAAPATAQSAPPAAQADAEPATGADASAALTGDPAMAGEPAATASGRVARWAFTTGVADREPADDLSSLSNDHDQVLFFTELRELEGQTVVHRWEYNGEVKAEVPFEVAGPRWRVHSSKSLDSGWLGEWSVVVVADGQELHRHAFRYTDAAAGPAAAAE